MDKATRRALKSLTYVPRFRGHTIYYPTTVLFGKSKVRLIPLQFALSLPAALLRHPLDLAAYLSPSTVHTHACAIYAQKEKRWKGESCRDCRIINERV